MGPHRRLHRMTLPSSSCTDELKDRPLSGDTNGTTASQLTPSSAWSRRLRARRIWYNDLFPLRVKEPAVKEGIHPEVPRDRGAVRVWRDVEDPIDQAGAAPRNLQQLPSVLHRPAEAGRHGRPGRALYQAIWRPDVREPEGCGEDEEVRKDRRHRIAAQAANTPPPTHALRDVRRSAPQELSVCFFGYLSVEPCQPVPHPIGAAAFCVFKSEQRQLTGAIQVAIAMLVVNRERFGRELPERAHARHSTDRSRFGQLHDFTPDGRRFRRIAARAGATAQVCKAPLT